MSSNNIQTVTYKLPGTRKARRYVVYPKTSTDGGKVLFQADDAIGRLDPVTGEGMFNVNAGGAYSVHLNPALGAKPRVFPREFVEAIVNAQAKPGERIGPGVYVA